MAPLVRRVVESWKIWRKDQEEEIKAKSDLKVIMNTGVSKRLLQESESFLSIKTSEAVKSKTKFLDLLRSIKCETVMVSDIRVFLDKQNHKEDVDVITPKVIGYFNDKDTRYEPCDNQI